MVEKIFLTDSRRDVLEGDSDLSDQSLLNAKSRIRVRARLALEELIEVAESSEIDNAEIFEPEQMARLVAAVISPPSEQITPRYTFDGDPEEYREQYEYPMAVTWRLDHITDGYADTLLRTELPEPDTEGPNLVWED